MVEVIPNKNLTFRDYRATLEQNPSNIFYQRVSSRNVSTTNCSFTVSSPNKRSYLLSDPSIEWEFTFLRTTVAANLPVVGTPAPYNNDRDLISLKPVLPICNAMSSITVAINGSTTTIAQPRRFMECLSMLNVSREEAVKYYEAGYPEKMGGQMNQGTPSQVFSYNELDATMMDQYYDFANRQLRGSDQNVDEHLTHFTGGQVDAGGTILVTEKICAPPFDCYARVDKASMPDWSPWKWMSPTIPNIDRLSFWACGE